MANERQFRIRTRFIATRGVEEYRATIPHLVEPDDAVMELGCEWGTTTVLLATRTTDVLGTDVSSECIERARKMHPHIRFEVLDAFDVRAAFELSQSRPRSFNKLYMDLSGLSGYRSTLDVIGLLTMYATVLRPQAIVVKSGALKQFAGLCTAWHGPESVSHIRGADRGR
jgi:hypothetical protein